MIMEGESGMSLRDYFAAAAMQGLMSSDSFDISNDGREFGAKLSYDLADAMLAARESK